MTILSVIRAVCPVVGLDVPGAVFSSIEREHVELQALANEMSVRIAKEHDWNRLKSVATIIGDGATEAFPLPTDYDRMLKEGQLWTSRDGKRPLTHIVDSDIWLSDQVSGYAADNAEWTVYGTSLYVRPTPLSGETISYFYIRTVPEYTLDTDVFLLSERVLKLGMIWQWKANKGLPYAEDMMNFETALGLAIKDDAGPGLFEVGSPRTRPSLNYAYPVELTP